MRLTKIQQAVLDKLTYGNYHIGNTSEGRHALFISGFAVGFGRVHGSTINSLVRRGLIVASHSVRYTAKHPWKNR